MKRFILIAAMLVLWGVTTAAAREVYNIDSGWIFFTDDDPSTDNSSVVNLPHIQTTAGLVNYMKDIEIPSTWEGRRLFLRIGGAARVTDIFVDGTHAAAHSGSGAAFTVEITDRVRWGVPASIRIVANSSPSLDVLPTAGGEKTYGGIFRSVELIVCNQLSVSPVAQIDPTNGAATTNTATNATPVTKGGSDGIWITTDRLDADRAEGRVRLSLLVPADTPANTSANTPQGATANVRVMDADGNTVAQGSRSVSATDSTLDIPFTVPAPRLWQGVEDPYLYDVEVRLTDGEGLTTDSMRLATGFRTVAIDGEGNFTLNGRPMKLHGVVLHRDRMVVGTALTPFQIEEDVDFILEMGANAVRVAGGRHSDYFYDLCNEAGLLVWNDGPFTGAAYPTDIDFVDTEAFRDNGRLQMAETVSQLYNHPSVVVWGVFSNVSARTAEAVEYIRELDALVRLLDPQRLTGASSVRDGEVNFITDLISFDLSLGWESGLPGDVAMWLMQLRRGWPNLRAGISYGAGASIFHQSEQLERPSPAGNFHPEGWQTFFHEQYVRNAVDEPGLWGVFVGNMFDSGAAKAIGATPGISAASSPAAGGAIDDRGLVTFDRKDRKDAFWLYKANWNISEPFVHIAGARLGGRSERNQTIHVYSNLPEVELFVGGRSQGRRTGEKGIFVWEDLEMRTGVNRLEARATGVVGSASGSGTSDAAGSSGGANSGSSSGSGVPGGSGSSGSVRVSDRTSINIYPSVMTSL
ncbi:MAG: glycoside hydrolase family 2 protein [Alistipes sp.]|jgi:beta-galactosidase|nr:glycoside hydrolase family 2 protein [Alistipes sp.]